MGCAARSRPPHGGARFLDGRAFCSDPYRGSLCCDAVGGFFVILSQSGLAAGTLLPPAPRSGWRPGGADGFAALRRGRGVLSVFTSPGLQRSPPNPQPLGPLEGARGVGCEMAWRADFRCFPCTLYRRPMGGRRGADDAAGGLCAAAPQGGSALVSTLPLAGVRRKWRVGALQALGPREPVGGTEARMALLHCEAVEGVGCFSSRRWLVSGTP